MIKLNKLKRNPPAIIRFMIKKETQIAFATILSFISFYLILILLFYLFSGSRDHSLIDGIKFSELSGINGEISNIGGPVGAWISNIIINHWFGIPAIIIPVFLSLIALKIFQVIKTDILKLFIVCTISMLWLSMFLGFTFKPLYENSYIYWGGAAGIYIPYLISKSVGMLGTALILILSLLLFLIYLFKNTSVIIQKGAKRIFSTKKDNNTDTDEEPADKYHNNEPCNKQENPPYEAQETISNPVTNNNDQEEEDIPEKETTATNYEENLTSGDETEENTDSSNLEGIKTSVKIGKGDENGTDSDLDLLPDGEFGKKIKSSNDFDRSYLGDYDPKLDLAKYKFPTIELLKNYEDSVIEKNEEEQTNNMRRIREVLEQFKIKISSITATVGATITLYEIVPEPGVRIATIKNLEDDIALSLAAMGIRIIAPIPGKGTIGIEVPNIKPKIVSMKGIISSKKFKETKYELPIAIGKTITNDIFMVDLAKMPHVLVAGATGQGKSVGLNAMITSLLYKKHPAELKFVMVDPKMVEFSIYSKIEKHYLAKLPDEEKSIITDFTKVILTLNSLTKEMDDRYDLLMKANVRNIKEYNNKFVKRKLNPEKGHKFLPYIVVIIDEFGDLIMQAGKEIEMPIARIAQKARAVGIHMIIATQRPTTNIITGTIKANFPARIAFRVASSVDSKTILDTSGANQLIGRGDLLFSQGGSDVTRVQCAFVDTSEIENITNYIGNQHGYPTAFPLPEPTIDDSAKGTFDTRTNERDPLFEDAARLIVIHQQGSTSLVQRKFSIGYTRAGRIIDQLENVGIIGPSEGSKARKVYVEDENQLDSLLETL